MAHFQHLILSINFLNVDNEQNRILERNNKKRIEEELPNISYHLGAEEEATIKSTSVSAIDSDESDDYWLITSSFTQVFLNLLMIFNFLFACMYLECMHTKYI